MPSSPDHSKTNPVFSLESPSATPDPLEQEVEQLTRQVQQQSRTFETVLSASPNLVYMFDNGGRFIYANQLAAANFGVRPVDLIGKTWRSFDFHVGTFEVFLNNVSRVFKIGSTVTGSLSYQAEEGGKEFTYTLIPVMDVRGRVVNVVAYLNDITREREKDRVLEAQSRELDRSNLEMEEFARVASQDLSDPLKKVQRHLFSLEKSLEELGEHLHTETRIHLAGALQGADRMKVLLSDLLEYSRVGMRSESFRRVKMDDLIKQVEHDLVETLQNKGATVACDKIPVVWGNEARLRQLMKNLIFNGIQYNDTGNPIIEISVEERNEFWVFEVKDNGIGIESKDFESVFQIFHRLNRRTDSSGTGVGLALCRKIVALHGGEIWVRSMPGAGSSFFFTLPIYQHGGKQLTIDL